MQIKQIFEYSKQLNVFLVIFNFVPELHRKKKINAYFSNIKYPEQEKSELNRSMVIKKFCKNPDLNHFSLCSKIFCPINFFPPYCDEFEHQTN